MNMAIKRPPGPKGNFLLGVLNDFSDDQPQYLLDAIKEYGDIVHMRMAHLHVYLMGHPDFVREVLVSKSKSFEKASLDRTILGKFLGNGLLTSEGNFHRRQRRLAQPAFHMKRIQTYAEVMVDYTKDMLDMWQPDETRDIAEDMIQLTMHIVSKTLFDADKVTANEATAGSVGDAIHVLQEVSNHDYSRGFSLPNWIPIKDNRRRNKAVKAYNETVEKIIAERRATAVNGELQDTGDLLSMLMLSIDEEDGSTMEDRQLRDEVATLFAAGHETTSNALTWTWYLLSQNPDVEAKLHKELDTVLNGRFPTLDDLRNLPYTAQVIKESMRLYPPAWILNGRVAIEDVEIGGYTIPKGSIIFISPYVMHRLPQYFPDPEQFDPDRWTPEMEKELPKFAYIPFGGGARVCIGNVFAQMEAQLILATIAQQYSLRLQPNFEVVKNPQITMSPLNGLLMQLSQRDNTRQLVEPKLAIV
jgi:cytochrome P450